MRPAGVAHNRATAPVVAAEPIPVSGLFETHLTVSDLDRAVAFYRDVVGLSVAFETPERGAAFLWIGEPGESMLGLWALGSAPLGISLHIAFKTPIADVLGACGRLRSSGVTPLSFFATETMELYIYRNAFGCYMHGSLLPKNPALADFLIKTAVERKYGSFSPGTPDDSYAVLARDHAARRPR